MHNSLGIPFLPMSITTIPAPPEKSVLEMTDEEINEAYASFFPDYRFPENEKLQPLPIEFEKISFLKNTPVRYSSNSCVEDQL
jgi:hypothetical protein